MYGLTHVYYGFGKGKTTTALGVAIRAAGAGLNVEFVQFLKDGTSSEFKSLTHVPNIKYYNPSFIGFVNPEYITPNQLEQSFLAFDYASEKSKDPSVDILICDEILWAFELNLLTHSSILNMIKSKHKNLELILTGAMCHIDIMELVDYATEFKCNKHPYYSNIPARLGIEY
ncbi:cob(I)yrinic acid a,c-diamide adenosyltransferase [Candidatus Woesearchaeota archaeon]|nr:cob(I)yrinic acid a,c-diamide adenosyltransferase [Candidatus Woesearchaeota archaeon]